MAEKLDARLQGQSSPWHLTLRSLAQWRLWSQSSSLCWCQAETASCIETKPGAADVPIAALHNKPLPRLTRPANVDNTIDTVREICPHGCGQHILLFCLTGWQAPRMVR